MNVQMIKSIVFAAALAIAIAATPAVADERTFDRFELSLGGYDVFGYDSTARLTDRTVGLGLAFDPSELLGLDSRQTILRVDSAYRFNPRHALTFSWSRISSDNALSIRRELDWVDEEGNPITIPIGARVSSGLEYEIMKFGYLWTFYETDKVSLMAGAGLHRTEVNLQIDAETTSSGVRAASGDATLPLPVLTFELAYRFAERLSWFARAELFAISFDDWTGTYSDFQLGVQYRMTKHFSVGTALGSNSLRIEDEEPDTRFEFENRIRGVFLYLQGHF